MSNIQARLSVTLAKGASRPPSHRGSHRPNLTSLSRPAGPLPGPPGACTLPAAVLCGSTPTTCAPGKQSWGCKGTLRAQWPGNDGTCWPDGHHLWTQPWLPLAWAAKLNQNAMQQWFYLFFIFRKYGHRIQPFWNESWYTDWQNANELS